MTQLSVLRERVSSKNSTRIVRLNWAFLHPLYIIEISSRCSRSYYLLFILILAAIWIVGINLFFSLPSRFLLLRVIILFISLALSTVICQYIYSRSATLIFYRATSETEFYLVQKERNFRTGGSRINYTATWKQIEKFAIQFFYYTSIWASDTVFLLSVYFWHTRTSSRLRDLGRN